ncbi:hypothetical protein N665_0168s0023 [Sinapis alba]|nr:hypothetical protein N665_0168s0023 [Sinapis alba]
MWKIKAKVIRLWKQYSAAGGETIEMVLCDLKLKLTVYCYHVYIHGGKIHTSVKKELVAQFDPFLRQDYSLMVINFAVTHSCGSYRTINHGYKIIVLSTTNLSGFDPVQYKEVLDGTLNPDYLVDFIGQICEISHIEYINVNEKETKKLSLKFLVMKDFQWFFWGKVACDVNEAMQVRDDHSTIFVLRFGKIKVWKEERSVTNAYNVSEIGLNPPMIEVGKFIASLPKDDLPLAIVESKYSAIVNGVSDKNDFFIHTPRKNIAQILETKQSVPTSTNDDGNDEDYLKHTYYCVKCKTYNPVNLPSNTKFLVFDNHVMKLLSQPCLQIAGPSNKFEIEEKNLLPLALNSIIGKTFLFKIQIERKNFVYKHETYKVLNVITNKDLISNFEEGNYPNVLTASVL